MVGDLEDDVDHREPDTAQGNKHTDHRDSGAGRPRATGMIRALHPVSR